MQTSNVSEPILSTSNGWFRYNFDENRLEFLNHNTKLVMQTWDIPTDQWKALPSQKEYCEHIIQETENQTATNKKQKNKLGIIGVVAIIIAIICFLSLRKETKIDQYIWILVIFSIAVPIGSRALSNFFHI